MHTNVSRSVDQFIQFRTSVDNGVGRMALAGRSIEHFIFESHASQVEQLISVFSDTKYHRRPVAEATVTVATQPMDLDSTRQFSQIENSLKKRVEINEADIIRRRCQCDDDADDDVSLCLLLYLTRNSLSDYYFFLSFQTQSASRDWSWRRERLLGASKYALTHFTR